MLKWRKSAHFQSYTRETRSLKTGSSANKKEILVVSFLLAEVGAVNEPKFDKTPQASWTPSGGEVVRGLEPEDENAPMRIFTIPPSTNFLFIVSSSRAAGFRTHKS